MLDRHLSDCVEEVLGRLSVPVSVLDKSTEVDDGAGKTIALLQLAEGVCHQIGQKLYLPVNQQSAVLCCQQDAPGAEDILFMAQAFIASFSNANRRTENRHDVYRHILLGDISGAELEALSNEHQLPKTLPRCIMVFHLVSNERERAYDLLDEITPLQGKDVLIDMDKHTAVLIKDVSDLEELDDLV